MREFPVSKTLLALAFFVGGAVSAADNFDAAWTALHDGYSFPEKDPFFASVLGLRYTNPPGPAPTYNYYNLETYPTGEPYVVNCLMQKQRADLVVIIPGLGSSQYGAGSRVPAQHFFDSGYSACVMSNSFSPEIYWHQNFVPGDILAEQKFFWEVTRSIMIQLNPLINKVHLLSFSYGTQVARGIVDLYQRDIDYMNDNIWRKHPMQIASAVYLSPPRSLMKSLQVLDTEWNQYRPTLKNVGTIPLIQLSLAMLKFIDDGTLDKSNSNEEYRAFILKMGFYSGMEEVAAKVAERHRFTWAAHPLDFASYYKEILVPLSGEPKEIPDFSTGWEKNRVPSLILFSDDDIILGQDDLQALRSIDSPQNDRYSMMLKGGGHLGYVPRADVIRAVDQFTAQY